MALYFMVWDARRFREELTPAFAAAWSRRSFAPCRPACARWAAEAAAFAQRFHVREEPMAARVRGGLPFDRHFWQLLVGETLLFSAEEVPEIQTAPEVLYALGSSVGGGTAEPRSDDVIRQAHFGTCDVAFGTAFYRPGHAAYNGAADVARLADQLAAMRPEAWTADALRAAGWEDEDAAEELDFARASFPALRELYAEAAGRGRMIVCEVL